MASKIGAGIFQNAYGHGANVITAGQKDYQMRMMQIEKQREDYYRKLGTPPGVPTMKGATAEPENTHEGYNTIIKELGDHSVPDGWIQRPKRNAVPGTPPGPPVQWDKAEDPDDVQPGYGYVPADTAHHEDIFYYHTDHLGSTSYITDAKANVAQFDAYLPYGELLVDEHSSTEEMPYKFNGKEFDQETGLYYYGARYMNPRTSLWYGVDPLAEKYPNVSAYIYCLNNPIGNIDTNGKIVTAADALARRNIINTLSKEEAHYVRFDKQGVLDVTLLNSYKGNSENFAALRTLANSKTNYIFAVSDQDVNGMRFYEKGSDKANPDNFCYGVTNMPGMENNPSPNENVYIFTASFLDGKMQARNTAHEGYGHAYFFELSKTDPTIIPNHTKGVVGTGIEYDPELKRDVSYIIFGQSNTALENQIKKVEKQAVTNYEEKNP